MAGWLTLIASRTGLREIEDALADVRKKMGDVKPLLKVAGDIYKQSTLDRFKSHSDPLGRGWAWLKPDTIRQKRKGNSRRGPSIGDSPSHQWIWTGKARGAIKVRFQAKTVIQIGFMDKEVPYARSVHYGAPKRNIPARPLLGVTKKANQQVLDAMKRFLKGEKL